MEETDFNKLCRLCHISVAEEDKNNFLKSIDSVLAYITQLNDIDTEGVQPCLTVNETLHTVMREDIPEAPLSRDHVFANAPAHTGGMFRVPPVLKQ